MDDQRCSSLLVADDQTPEHLGKLRNHTSDRVAAGRARVEEQFDRGTRIARFNAALALATTKGVGSMWCLRLRWGALFGLPGAIHGGVYDVVR
jgi:hypothetical protein